VVRNRDVRKRLPDRPSQRPLGGGFESGAGLFGVHATLAIRVAFMTTGTPELGTSNAHHPLGFVG
jgi:hypothetical protein